MEAGIKYFMVGASSSAVMLFGLSYLFGVAHTTYVAGLIRVLPGLITSPAAILGLILTLCGFFFKLAVFPFHYWAPDVYPGGGQPGDRLHRHGFQGGGRGHHQCE